MKSQLEKIEKNSATIKVEISNKDFLEAVKKAYFQNVKRFNINGFRKGKAPKNIIEKYYGEEIFFEDAINIIFQDCYSDVVKETGIEPVDRPHLEVKQIGKDKDLIFELVVTVKPEVTLGEYMGIEIDKVEYNVTDKDVENELKNVAEKNARIKTVEDRAVQNGDITTISYRGTIEGVEFEGGTSDEHKLTIGSGEFIEGFESQLIGAKLNDEVKVNVTFPEEYFKEELSGKPAVFDVKILKIEEKELPVIDDEFAKDVSEFETLEEYKSSIRDNLEKEFKDKEEIEKEDKVLSKVISNATVDIPEVMIERQIDSLLHDFEHKLKHQGVDLETYLTYVGYSIEDLKEQFREKATQNVKAQLVLEKIVSQEKIDVSEEEIKNEIEAIAKVYNVTEENFYDRFSEEDKEHVKEKVAIKKIVKNMVDSAKMKN